MFPLLLLWLLLALQCHNICGSQCPDGSQRGQRTDEGSWRPRAAEVDSWANCTNIDASIDLSLIDPLADDVSFPRLRRIEGDLLLRGLHAALSTQLMPNLQHIGGRLELAQAQSSASIGALLTLPSLLSIGGGLHLSNLTGSSLGELLSLPRLQTISTGFTLLNSSLESIHSGIGSSDHPDLGLRFLPSPAGAPFELVLRHNDRLGSLLGLDAQFDAVDSNGPQMALPALS